MIRTAFVIFVLLIWLVVELAAKPDDFSHRL